MVRIAHMFASLVVGVLSSVAVVPNVAVAGKYNQVLSIGDPAPSWKELIGVDEKTHSLEDWSGHKVIVVVFTCNSCPYAVDAEDRLISLYKKYSDLGVALIAINANKVEEDLLPAMKEKAVEKGFQFPYLFDESQQVARDYGARVTPECFVLDENRAVRYMGSIDDSPDGKRIEKKYLESAIDSILNGSSPEVRETVPIGCNVRFERQRSRRSRNSKAE